MARRLHRFSLTSLDEEEAMEAGKTLKPQGDTIAFFQMLAGCAIAVLVMLGVGGAFYNFVAPSGWLAQLFGRHAAGGFVALVALATVGAALWMLRERISPASRGLFSELFVYMVATAGGLYVLQLVLKGNF